MELFAWDLREGLEERQNLFCLQHNFLLFHPFAILLCKGSVTKLQLKLGT